jgi:predicted ATP-dependent serine protease
MCSEAGDPGVGKSSLIAKISAHLTAGQAFPDVLHGQAPAAVCCHVSP